MKLNKNINLGKINFINVIIFIFILFLSLNLNGEIKDEDKKNLESVKIKVLDKVSSKNSELLIKIGVEKKFKDLSIKILKCKNSEFDDNPETTAYLQVKDLSNKNNDEVFVFNGWSFSSSPSLNPFDHPVYDIWLVECY